jgi:hypothetical protein
MGWKGEMKHERDFQSFVQGLKSEALPENTE